MLLNLQNLELHPVPFKVEIPAGEIEYDGKIRQASSLRAEGVAEVANHALGEIRVRGTLAVNVAAQCDRCLEPASLAIEKEFDLLYLPGEQLQGGGEDELHAGDSEIAYYEGEGLELAEVLREVVLLAAPMRVVCSETCKGICPNCGRNRNVEPCDCHTQAADDRWNKLKALLPELTPRQ